VRVFAVYIPGVQSTKY